MPVRRLDAEQIRDAMLAVNGELDLTAGGPRRWSRPAAADASTPRSCATRATRCSTCSTRPTAFTSAADRNVTTTPTQALLLINSPFMLDPGQGVRRPTPQGPCDRRAPESTAAFRLAFGRAANAAERSEAVAFLAEQAKRINPKPDAAASIQYGKVPFREGRAALVAPDSPMGKLRVPDSSEAARPATSPSRRSSRCDRSTTTARSARSPPTAPRTRLPAGRSA